MNKWVLGLAALLGCVICTSGVKEARAQLFQADDLVIGVNSNRTDSFRHVRAGGGADPGVTLDGGNLQTSPSPWSTSFIQTVEFDNANGISHNAAGNLLGGNFGGGFTGFEVFNFATNGTGTFESLWGINTETGGARTDRGGGMSVSPDNTKIAWGNFDGASIQVLEYDAGSSVGTGSGASVTGWLETGTGNGSGGAGALSALRSGSTQSTTWLDNDTVLAFSGFGELISLDMSGETFGTTDTPNTTSNWVIEKSGILASSPGDAQFTGLYYNEDIDPDIIVGSAGFFLGGVSTTEIFVWDKTTFNQLAKIDISGTSETGREISMDSQGNLYIGGFGENIVSVIDDFVGKANAGTLTNNSSVRWFQNDFFASFSGLDVAASTGGSTGDPADINSDGLVDAKDFLQIQRDDPSLIPAWEANYPSPLVAAVGAIPEPSSLVLLMASSVLLINRRR